MKRLTAKLDPVWRRFPVRFAYLWGSRARGKARPGSDYDFAVSMRMGRRELNALLDLGDALASVLETDDVDVTLLEDANPEVRYLVQRNGRLIFEAEPAARRRFEHDARMRYWDEAIRLRRYARATARRIREGTFGT